MYESEACLSPTGPSFSFIMAPPDPLTEVPVESQVSTTSIHEEIDKPRIKRSTSIITPHVRHLDRSSWCRPFTSKFSLQHLGNPIDEPCMSESHGRSSSNIIKPRSFDVDLSTSGINRTKPSTTHTHTSNTSNTSAPDPATRWGSQFW